MKVQVTESGTWRRTLEIEAPAEDVEKRLDAAYRKYSKSLNLPGFRKGKVPLNIVKKQFGPAIQGEVIQEMVEACYREASTTEGLQPVSQASIEDIDFEVGKPLVFKASVDVRPQIEVAHYKGLNAVRSVMPVTEENIDAQLRYIQEQNAAEQTVERPAESGDVLLADVEELDEAGQPKPGARREDQRVRLDQSEDGNPSELSEQIMGIAAGESRDVKLKRIQPEGGHEGHEHPEEIIQFRISVKEVHERLLPAIDDELAKDAGDFETLDALKVRIRADMEEQAHRVARRQVEEHLVNALIEQNAFDVPDSMVETYLDGVIESYKREHAGHDHPIDEEAIRRDGKDSALHGVKRYLLLDAIAEQEKIAVEEADIDEHLQAMSAQYGIEAAQLRNILTRSRQLEQIYSDLQVKKTFDFLVEHAAIEDVEDAH